MKLHLPTGLRSSLLACICSVATLGTTLGTGALVVATFSGQAMAADQTLSTDVPELWVAPGENIITVASGSVSAGKIDALGENASYSKAGAGELILNGAPGTARPLSLTVDGGTLTIAYRAGWGGGFVSETATVNKGATLKLDYEDALGQWTTGTRGCTNIILNGAADEGNEATLNIAQDTRLYYDITLNGYADVEGAGVLTAYEGTPGITATGVNNTISTALNLNTGLTVNVTNAETAAKGETNGLVISGALTNDTTNGTASYTLTKEGTGALYLTGGSTASKSVLQVDAGSVEIGGANKSYEFKEMKATGADSAITVADGSTVRTTSNLVIGHSSGAEASLSITEGSTVYNRAQTWMDSNDASILVSGEGSKYIANNGIDVGSSVTAAPSLTLADGGALGATVWGLGVNAQVIIKGDATIQTQRYSSETLELESASVLYNVNKGIKLSSGSTLNIDGPGTVNISNKLSFDGAGATMNIAGASTVSIDSIEVNAGQFNGLFTGTHTLISGNDNANLTYTAGKVSVGGIEYNLVKNGSSVTITGDNRYFVGKDTVNYTTVTASGASSIVLSGGKLQIDGTGSDLNVDYNMELTADSVLEGGKDVAVMGSITGNHNLIVRGQDGTTTGYDAAFYLSGEVNLGSQHTLTVESGVVSIGADYGADASNSLVAKDVAISSGATFQLYHDGSKVDYSSVGITLNGGTLHALTTNGGAVTEFGTLTVNSGDWDTTGTVSNKWTSAVSFTGMTGTGDLNITKGEQDFTVTIASVTDYSGTLTINSGKVNITNATTFGGALAIKGGETSIGSAASISQALAVSGGSLNVNGTLTLAGGESTFSGGNISATQTVVESGATLHMTVSSQESHMSGSLLVKGNLTTKGDSFGWGNSGSFTGLTIDGGTWTIQPGNLTLSNTPVTLKNATVILDAAEAGQGVEYQGEAGWDFFTADGEDGSVKNIVQTDAEATATSVIKLGDTSETSVNSSANKLTIRKGSVDFIVNNAAAIDTAGGETKADLQVDAGVIVATDLTGTQGSFNKKGDGIMEMSVGFLANGDKKVNAEVQEGTLRLTGSARMDAGTVTVSGGSLEITTDNALSSSATITTVNEAKESVATISGKDGGSVSYSGVTVESGKVSSGTISSAAVTVEKAFELQGVTVEDCSFTVNEALSVTNSSSFTGTTTVNIGYDGKLISDGTLSLTGEGHELTLNALGSSEATFGDLTYTQIHSQQLQNLAASSDATFTLHLTGTDIAGLVNAGTNGLMFVFSAPAASPTSGSGAVAAAQGGLTFKLDADAVSTLESLGYVVNDTLTTQINADGTMGVYLTNTKNPGESGGDEPGAIPEPTTATLSLLALAALAARRRRK